MKPKTGKQTPKGLYKLYLILVSHQTFVDNPDCYKLQLGIGMDTHSFHFYFSVRKEQILKKLFVQNEKLKYLL